MEPGWLTAARRYLGVREIKGPKNSPVIQGWLKNLNAWWTDDETAWCGTFVAQVMHESGCKLPQHWYRARAWLDWGNPLAGPEVGAIVVFERGPAFGHVGIVTGRTAAGDLLVLGGNQGDAVSIAAFPRQRVIGYRWPSEVTLPQAAPLPLASAAKSTSEA